MQVVEYVTFFKWLNKKIQGMKYYQNDYPCSTCLGHGRIKDSEDWMPIEGSKFAKRIKCPACGGSGKKSVQDYYSEWQKEVAKENEMKILVNREKYLMKSIISKLTDEELQFLKSRIYSQKEFDLG